jgi:hypothetical protein
MKFNENYVTNTNLNKVHMINNMNNSASVRYGINLGAPVGFIVP